LVEFDLIVQELTAVSNEVLESLVGVKPKGYVKIEGLVQSNHFIKKIEGHLAGLGYKEKDLGTNNNTFTLWYIFIFLNLFYLVT
jgi:hypothetical protein